MRTPAPWSWSCLLASCAMLAAPLAAYAQDQLDEEPTTTLSDKPESRGSATAPAPRGGASAGPQSAADKKEADRKARELFEQGRAAFKEGKYRDAWEHFRDAYLLSKRPELLYNVGQSADRMRMDSEALAAFKLYLQRLPNAENRKEVQSRIVFLEKQVRRNGEVEQSPTTLDDSSDSPATVGVSGSDGDATTQSPESLPDSASSGADTSPDFDERSDDSKPEVEQPTNTNGQPERTKWYARAALGLGFLADSLTDSAAKSLSSVTISGELGIGYDIHEGVVIGGGLTFDWGLAPSAKIGDVSNAIDTANLTLLMAFVDYYLAPRENGWHLLGGLGYGGLALSDKSTTVGVENGSGGGFILGGGCEWPLDQDWAIGGMLKVVLARMSTDTATHTIFAPSAVATATWY